MRAASAGAALLLVALAGCQAPRPAFPGILHEAHRPVPLRRAQPPGAAERSPAAAEWSFSAASGECVATAVAPRHAPTITVRVDDAVHLGVSSGGARRLAFSGPGGSWTLHSPERRPGQGRETEIAMPLGEAALSRLVALLAGGRLRIEGGARPATLILPDAGISGRDWIGCATGRTKDLTRQATRADRAAM